MARNPVSRRTPTSVTTSDLQAHYHGLPKSKHGHPFAPRKAVVGVAAEEWERKTGRAGNLAEFFAASPLRASRMKAKRMAGRPRKLDL